MISVSPPPPPNPPAITLDGQIIRKSTANNMCLSLDAALPGRDAGLVQMPCNSKDKSQRFAFLHVAGGYYQIMPSARSKTLCWTAPALLNAFTRPSLERCSDGSNVTQEFLLSPIHSTGWEIKPRMDQRLCLDVTDRSPDAGTPMQFFPCRGDSYPQRFELPNFNPAQLVQLQKVVTSTAAKCITVAKEVDNLLEQYDCNARERVTSFIFLSTGGGTYRIASSSDIRKCWTVGGPDPNTIGRRITLEDCINTASNQQFMTVPQEGGWMLKAKFNNDRCVNVQYSGRGDGTPIWMWVCDGTLAQKFSLPGFQPVLQQVVFFVDSQLRTRCVDYAPKKPRPVVIQSLQTAPCKSGTESQKFFLVHGISNGPFYRVFSASDFSKCWTVLNQTNFTDRKYRERYPVALTECIDGEITQEFALLQNGFSDR
ncbi:hypothetical protein VaNZ11_002274 [Volvox africanus]|uniref:Ricin B lectin domain-containing protein n=1 Tax=Volvox africanus TaxID=51714 RepID=A0ABQ5RSA5_9CHLO|nr:hypothetical protein VaNZ11_002274 [Volvox africanus]